MARHPKEAYHLTDAEKRDLTQSIQQGKTLPEHIYIDPLFDVGAHFSTDIEISGILAPKHLAWCR